MSSKKKLSTKRVYKDGEVLGREEKAGHLIQWDAKNKVKYISGETLEEYGLDNLTSVEIKRLKIPVKKLVHILLEETKSRKEEYIGNSGKDTMYLDGKIAALELILDVI